MRAKEFWIYDTENGNQHFRRSEPTGIMSTAGYTHVREVLPDTVTITREQLRTALNAATKIRSIGQNEYWDTDFSLVELGLFASTAKTGDER